MESNDSGDENTDNTELDTFSQLEGFLKACNKVIRHKEITLPCALSDDIDLTDLLNDDNLPKVKPHKHLQDNANLIHAMMDDISKLKHTSETAINFDIDEGQNLDDEINQTMLRFRQQTDKLIKKIINTQVEFNECLNSNITNNNSENKNHIQEHFKIIEQTCKLDRGLESVIRCKEDTLQKNIKKDLKMINEVDLKNVSNEIRQGVLNKVFEAGKKKFKDHEHLLEIKKYNIPTKTGVVVEKITTGTLDPYTRQKITKPVRNKVCTHVYDQESVDLMFQGKFFVSCPYIGCTNNHFTKKDLVYEYKVTNDSE